MTFLSSNRQIVLITGFKSGTWLMRKIMNMLLDSRWYEPDFVDSDGMYSDIKNVVLKEDGYYSWHLNPTYEIRESLVKLDAKVVMLLRNIFEVSVSILHLFYYDLDASIGRSSGKKDFLQRFDLKDAQTLVITGFNCDGYRWEGLTGVVEHYLNCIEFALSYPDRVFLMDYKNLMTNKSDYIKKLADFLNIDITQEKLIDIVNETDFNTMKTESKNLPHFRKGLSGKAKEELSLLHIKLIESIVNFNIRDDFKNYKELFVLE